MADYIWLELLIICTVVALGGRDIPWRHLATTRMLLAFLGLFVLWFLVDFAAVSLGLWYFPEGGTLSVRILAIPLEEYALFLVHTFVVAVVLLVLRQLRRA